MRRLTNYAARMALISGLIVLSSFSASAQNLVIVRSGQELAARGLDPSLKERISRGQLVFQFGTPLRNKTGFYPYQTVIVYPAAYATRRELQFTGKDASGNLYFHGYPVAPSGWISVRVDPPDAEVLINGLPVMVDANSGISVKTGFPVGIHTVEVHRQDLKSYEGEIELKQASEVRIDIKLTK
jgi:hypothetical protein